MDPVLLTRPRADSDRWAAQLRAAGACSVIVSPLLRIVRRGALPDWSGGLLLTSGNAVRAYRELSGPGGLPTWCVGPRTADLARSAGLDVRMTAPDAVTLAASVPDDAPPLLHLRGAVQRGDLAGDLRKRGLDASDAVIYDAVPEALTEEALAAIASGPVVAPIFSPRSAALLLQAWPTDALSRLRAVCLSPAVAEILPVPAAVVAETPDGTALFAAVMDLLGAKGG